MQRADVLFVSDCPSPRFEAYRRRGQLPFAHIGPLAEPSAASAHANDYYDSKSNAYTLEDAFKLRVFLDALSNSGADADEARQLVDAVDNHFARTGAGDPADLPHPLDAVRDHVEDCAPFRQLYVSLAQIITPSTDSGFRIERVYFEKCQLRGLWAGAFDQLDEGERIARIITLDVTGAAVFLYDRALKRCTVAEVSARVWP